MTNPAPRPAGVEIDGAKLREMRKLQGDTLKDFASKCGIGFQYLSQIERGDKQAVSPPTFVRICDALGVKQEDRPEMVRTSKVAA